MSKLEQAVEAAMLSSYPRGTGTIDRQRMTNALRPFFEAPVEVDLDLSQRIKALVEELGEGWSGHCSRVVAKHLNALAAELPAPRVSDDDIEEAAADVTDLLKKLETPGPWPTRMRIEGILRERFQPKPKPRVWPESQPYPEDPVSSKLWLPRGTDRVWLILDDSIIPQALGQRLKGRWSSVELKGGCWLEDERVEGWCRLKEGPSA